MPSSPIALTPLFVCGPHDLAVASHRAGYGQAPEPQVAVVAVHVVIAAKKMGVTETPIFLCSDHLSWQFLSVR